MSVYLVRLFFLGGIQFTHMGVGNIAAQTHVPWALQATLLQDLLQSCSRGGGRIVEDMCYERRRAEACVD
jgi:hypothetical protein